MAYSVLTVYAALAVWLGLAVQGYRTQRWLYAILFGLALAVYLNVGYLINGPAAAIAGFIGIYDVLNNLGVGPEGAGGLGACPDNACTVWGDTFQLHTTWGVAFYDRFANGPEFRTNLLYGHIVGNTIALVLITFQMFRPGGSPNGKHHKLIGRIAFLSLTFGVACAAWLASEHGPVDEYGGVFASWGFWEMSAVVYGCACMGVVAIMRGDARAHRVWMWRLAGSMWGSFWLFRVMLFVLDPLLRDYEAAAIQWCIWASAPLGLLIAEMIRRRIDAPKRAQTAPV